MERERRERRTQILDAAQQVFNDRGFDAATMDEVAEMAQLGKGTLYNYFRTKEDLLGGVAARHMQRMVGKYQRAGEEASDGRDQVRRMMLAYAEHMSTSFAHLQMVISRFIQGPPPDPNGSAQQLMRDNVMQLMGLYEQAIQRGQRDGSIRPDLEPMPLCMQLWSCVNGALLLKLQLSHDHPPPEIKAIAPTVADTVELLVDAIAPREAEIPESTTHGAVTKGAGDAAETSEAS
jgi:AcrR family transcriptional regulator